MKETLLFQTFETLDKRELRELKKFINSPYFNQRPDVIALFDYLASCLHDKKKVLSKEMAFETMFPNMAFDDHKVRLASSFLLQLIEDFWAIENTKLKLPNSKFLSAIQYRQRNLDKHYQRTMLEAKQSIENQNLRNANFHLQYYEILLEEFQFHAVKRQITPVSLQVISENLDNAYYTLKLRQECAVISFQNIYRSDFQGANINNIIQQIEQNNLINIPSVGIYYHAFHCLKYPEKENHFFEIKTMITRFGNLFPKNEIRDLYLIAINYCIRKHNEGNEAFLKEELDLYEEGLQNKYLHINNKISRFTYRNVVTLAITLKEYKRAAIFIETYKSDLETIYQEGNYNYCKARLAYEQKDYKNVFLLLQQADYEELLISLAAKALLLKTFYETQEYDALEAHLEAMRNFLRRKNFMSYHKENYLNLIKLTKSLLKINSKNKKELSEFKQKIEDTKALVERKWLLDAVENLK